jgi:hypothetical protein
MAWKASNILNHKFLFNIYLKKKKVLLEKNICYIFINKNEQLQKKEMLIKRVNEKKGYNTCFW